ncbi:MAG: hypothetical protein K5945_05515 [Bacteroidaceae bacterium]|nr:hypothetical protein [Bacteroidaceae bacterium]
MKRNTFHHALLAATFATALSSCMNDPERHELQMVYPVSSYLFADQTVDSLMFLTFDNWKVSLDESDWISVVGPKSGEFKYDYYTQHIIKVDLAMQPNTTGVTRRGYVRVNSYKYEGYASYVQYGFLEVTRPEYTPKSYLGEYNTIPKTVEFCLTDSASWELDSLSFYTEKPWTLTFKDPNDSTWVKPQMMSGEAGPSRVNLNLVPNTADERKATFVLTSSGISTEISVCQLAPEPEIAPAP